MFLLLSKIRKMEEKLKMEDEQAQETQEQFNDAAGESNVEEVAEETVPQGYTEDELELKLAEERARWEAELEEKERLSKLSLEEREKEEKLKNEKRIAELEKTILTKDLREKATKDFTKAELPVELVELLDYTSKETMEQSGAKVKEIFTKSVEKEVLKKLRGGTPRGQSGANSTEQMLKSKIAESIRGGF